MNIRDNNISVYPLSRLAKQLKLHNRTRNKSVLYDLIMKDKIRTFKKNGDSYKLNNDGEKFCFMEQLFQMIDLFDKKFDKNWDIHLHYHRFDFRGNECLSIDFVIYYPEVLVQNSRDEERPMKDFFIILPVYFDSEHYTTSFSWIYGTKAAFAHDEWYSNYIHSHINTSINKNRINTFSMTFESKAFCIGTEDVSEMIMEMSVHFDINQMELFLYTLDSFVSWESVEGTPYRYMSEICIQDERLRVSNEGESTYRDLNNRLISYWKKDSIQYPFKADFVFDEGRYKVKRNEKFIESIKNVFLAENALNDYKHIIICKRGEDNHFYTYKSVGSNGFKTPSDIMKGIKDSNITEELPFTYIQGKKIEFSVYNEQEIRQEDIKTYTIYPIFLEYVAEQLESNLYKTCVAGSGIYRLSNSSSNAEAISA